MTKKKPESEVVIVGAGPAGASLSFFLSKEKIPHIIIDKALFPRDKVCGDACTPEVPRVLREISEDWYQEFVAAPWVQASSGMSFEYYDGQRVDLILKEKGKSFSTNFVAERKHFDDFLVKKIDPRYATLMLGHTVSSITRENGIIKLVAINGQEEINIKTKLIIGADGERSIVRKTFHPKGIIKNRAHHCAAIRCYFEGLTEIPEQLPLEFYVPTKEYPCYFWIFYLPNGKANVGIGALSATVSKKKINLKKVMLDFIQKHPLLSKRFANAKQLGKIEGWGIPFNSDANEYYGDNYLLIGDSAKFAEPSTGKGIGIAMYASMLAAPVVINAIKTKDYTADNLKTFEIAIEKKFRGEWKKLYQVQRIAEYPMILKSIVRLLRIPFVKKSIERSLINTYIRFIEKPLANKKN